MSNQELSQRQNNELRYQVLMFEQFCAALMYETSVLAMDFDFPEGSKDFLA